MIRILFLQKFVCVYVYCEYSILFYSIPLFSIRLQDFAFSVLAGYYMYLLGSYYVGRKRKTDFRKCGIFNLVAIWQKTHKMFFFFVVFFGGRGGGGRGGGGREGEWGGGNKKNFLLMLLLSEPVADLAQIIRGRFSVCISIQQHMLKNSSSVLNFYFWHNKNKFRFLLFVLMYMYH